MVLYFFPLCEMNAVIHLNGTFILTLFYRIHYLISGSLKTFFFNVLKSFFKQLNCDTFKVLLSYKYFVPLSVIEPVLNFNPSERVKKHLA